MGFSFVNLPLSTPGWLRERDYPFPAGVAEKWRREDTVPALRIFVVQLGQQRNNSLPWGGPQSPGSLGPWPTFLQPSKGWILRAANPLERGGQRYLSTQSPPTSPPHTPSHPTPDFMWKRRAGGWEQRSEAEPRRPTVQGSQEARVSESAGSSLLSARWEEGLLVVLTHGQERDYGSRVLQRHKWILKVRLSRFPPPPPHALYLFDHRFVLSKWFW